MNPALLNAILVNIILPELAAFLRRRHDDGLPPPTKEELIAEMEGRADRLIEEGENFLRMKENPIG